MDLTEIPGYGFDRRPSDRPGVPMERPPSPLEGARELPRQAPPARLYRKVPPRLTVVSGTALPVRGVSGAMRRLAYRVPDHRARRWLLLLAADRVDVLEHRALRRGLPLLALAAGGALVWRRLAAGGR